MNEELDISAAKRLLLNDDWTWAKSKLEAMVDVYLNSNLTGTDTTVGREYKRRKDVAALLRSWIEYIEGSAQIPSEVLEQSKLVQRF